MSVKQKVCNYYLGRKVFFCRWVHCRCSDLPNQVSLLSCQDIFVCRTCLDHNCLVEKK